MSAARLDEWGLRAAEQLESSVGAWVALASFKRLFEAAPPVRARAILGAMRCAAALRDTVELEALVLRWATAEETLATEEPLQLARAELARGAWPLAAALARAELQRRPRARTAYATARLLEGLGHGATGDEALVVFARAQHLGAREGDLDVAAASAARRLEALEESARAVPGAPYRAPALAIVADVDPAHARGSAKLLIARARLLSPGRFVRAGALSALGELAAAPDARLADAAAWAIGSHVDAMGTRLSPLEAERALAGLRASPEGAKRESAVARAEAIAAIAAAPLDRREAALADAARADAASAEIASRARHLDEAPPSRSFGRERFADPFVRLAAIGLEALGAIAHGSRSAAGSLEAAYRAIGPGEAVPAPLWQAAMAGLAATGEVRSAAVSLASALAQRASGEPPGGFSALGVALASAGALAAALEALRWAARSKEPEASATLARVATRAAWRAHERGEVASARELLLEARTAAAGR